MHLLVFEGSVFAPHLDDPFYPKKQFLNEVKEVLTTDKLFRLYFQQSIYFFG